MPWTLCIHCGASAWSSCGVSKSAFVTAGVVLLTVVAFIHFWIPLHQFKHRYTTILTTISTLLCVGSGSCVGIQVHCFLARHYKRLLNQIFLVLIHSVVLFLKFILIFGRFGLRGQLQQYFSALICWLCLCSVTITKLSYLKHISKAPWNSKLWYRGAGYITGNTYLLIQ